jgi:GntR family transcriptional repressor for pyruvate dehydrogenase complex
VDAHRIARGTARPRSPGQAAQKRERSDHASLDRSPINWYDHPTIVPLAPVVLARTTTVDACADALRAAILGRELAAGERLPPERELAARFGVNRVTVRSALVRLASEGLLRARQGSGHVVRDFVAEGGPSLLPGLAELAREGGNVRDLAEDLLLVRRSLARGVLERLASRPPSARARKAVAAAVDAFAATVERGASAMELAEADVVVVGRLIEATGSPVLRLCLNPVLGVLRDVPELVEAIYADAAASVLSHRAVLAWLQDPSIADVPRFVSMLEARDATTLAHLAKKTHRRAGGGRSRA